MCVTCFYYHPEPRDTYPEIPEESISFARLCVFPTLNSPFSGSFLQSGMVNERDA